MSQAIPYAGTLFAEVGGKHVLFFTTEDTEECKKLFEIVEFIEVIRVLHFGLHGIVFSQD
jgi:hypothetical protein